jgi:hypothetical protein
MFARRVTFKRPARSTSICDWLALGQLKLLVNRQKRQLVHRGGGPKSSIPSTTCTPATAVLLSCDPAHHRFPAPRRPPESDSLCFGAVFEKRRYGSKSVAMVAIW